MIYTVMIRLMLKQLVRFRAICADAPNVATADARRLANAIPAALRYR